jgi:hypothetical protein
MSDAYGVRINNGARQRQIDGRKIVPQLIATYNMAAYSFYEAAVNNGQAQDGFIMRRYNFPYDPNVFNRPVVSFFSLQNDGHETYLSGSARIMYRPGAYVAHPMLYVFALDYVTSSGSAWGRRVWNGSKQLMYDSGNAHLNVLQVLGGNINNDFDVTGRQAYGGKVNITSPLGGFPQFPMICADDFDHYFYNGNKSGIAETRSSLFYRPLNNNLEVMMLSYDRTYTEDQTIPAARQRLVSPSPFNRRIMVIDRDMY